MDLPEKLVSWLQDAHAIELHAKKVLHSFAKKAQAYPELSARINQHMAETRRHAMAGWLLEHLPGLTRKYLDQSGGYGEQPA